MTNSNSEDDLSGYVPADYWLPHMTPALVESTFADFDLPLAKNRHWGWVSLAARRSLACTLPTSRESPRRASNAETKRELEKLAKQAGDLWCALFQAPPAIDDRAWDFAFANWNGEGGTDVGNGVSLGAPPLFDKYKSAISELDWLRDFLVTLARETEAQRGPWRQSEQRRIRIERGQFLAAVFEEAFGHPVSVNNWPQDALHPEPTPFMIFYQKMVELAFGERATPDLPGVLKEARKLHLEQPVQFAEGIIPDW